MASNAIQARTDARLHVIAYNTSKAAANSYTIALAQELRKEGICCHERYSDADGLQRLKLTSQNGNPYEVRIRGEGLIDSETESPMANQYLFSPPDADGFQRMKLTSQNGNPCEVRIRANEGLIDSETKSPLTLAANKITGTFYDVSWPTGDEAWKDVSGMKRITKYRLFDANGIFWKYELGFDISSSGLGTTLIFKDERDSYKCVTFRGGKHWVAFNSDDVPTIVEVVVGSD